MQHGQTWNGQNVEGWIATEKFDGIRAYWDGATLWTRGGNAVPIPDEWKEALPSGVHLDGELFAGNGNRKKAELFAKRGEGYSACQFMVFDVPSAAGCYQDRMEAAQQYRSWVIQPVTTATMDSLIEAVELMQQVQAVGGEGLILRHPELAYTPGRTDKLLKLKTWEIN
jgi:DNA ligase-1